MKNRGLVALLFFLLSAVNEAKRFEKCELAKVLKKAGLDKYKGVTIADWICLVYHESRFETRAVKGPNPEGARSYGLFQINGHWWCASGKGKPKLGCGVYCKAFMNDDITDDIACVKIIAREPNRMNAWEGWKRNCKGKNLSQWTRGCKF